MIALSAASLSFTPQGLAPAPASRVAVRTDAPLLALQSEAPAMRRRTAVGVTLAALVAIPNAALADDNDDAMARIAAKSMAKNEEEKQRVRDKVAKRLAKGKTEEQEVKEQQKEAKNNILLIAGGGTVLSTAFFYRNIQRLFTKVLSGGDDDGYNSIPEPKRGGRKATKLSKKAQQQIQESAASKQSTASKLAQAAFGRKLF